MKKIFYSMLALTIAAFSFTSCEDVPEPYALPNNGGGDDNPTVVVDPTGDGTQASPYNVTALLEQTASLSSGDTLANDVYVKGIVSSIKEAFSSQYGNGTFYISDDGTTENQFYVYRAYYLGNKKYTDSDTPLQVGDTVVVYGSVMNYAGNTIETVQNKAYVYSINGKTGTETNKDNGEATGDGTLENPFNVAAAISYTSALASNAKSDKEVYIKGKISSIREAYTTQYGNGSFYISDDGTTTTQFLVFRALYLNNQKYTEGDTQVQVGDDVIVYGKVTNYYGNTPETVQGEAYLYSLVSNGGTTGGDEEIGDQTSKNGGFEAWSGSTPTNWTTTSTAGNATLSQSTDAHSGSYSVCVTGTTSGNKRLAYKETELKAGEYTLTFYAKAATSTGASLCPGYVQVTDGKVGSYNYGNYTDNISNTSWVQVTHTFTIAADGTYCIVIMNSKSVGGNLLIDDVKLTTGSTVIIE